MQTIGVVVVGLTLLLSKLRDGHRDTTGKTQPTQSSIDGVFYNVVQTPNAIDAANQLCRTKDSVNRVLRSLTGLDSHPQNVAAGVMRLLHKHPDAANLHLVELHPEDAKQTLAYNEGKSSNIFLCMRQSPPSQTLGPDDVLLYIVLHELAHTMIEGYAPMDSEGRTVHDAVFREHNEYLNHIAEQLGLLRPGKVPGMTHCGVTMPDPDNSV